MSVATPSDETLELLIQESSLSAEQKGRLTDLMQKLTPNERQQVFVQLRNNPTRRISLMTQLLRKFAEKIPKEHRAEIISRTNGSERGIWKAREADDYHNEEAELDSILTELDQ